MQQKEDQFKIKMLALLNERKRLNGKTRYLKCKEREARSPEPKDGLLLFIKDNRPQAIISIFSPLARRKRCFSNVNPEFKSL
jgi:hypothetical protein